MRWIVDTSVWSLAFRRRGPVDHPKVAQLQTALDNDDVAIFMVGVVLQEVLQAFRDDSTFQKMSSYFEAFPLLPFDRTDAIEGAWIHRQCAAHGVTCSTTDCAIAANAIRHGCNLLTTDRDFDRIARWTPLRTVE